MAKKTNQHNLPPLDTARSWLVVMSSSLLFLYSFFILNILSSVSPLIMKDFDITPIEMGMVSSMYFYSNFFFLFPAGILLDRLSTKKLVLFAMATGIIGMFGFAVSPNAIMASIFRFISGISGSFCLVANVRLASKWFSPKKLALVVGVIITLAMLGGFLAQTPAAFVTDLVGWRWMMILSSFLGVVFWIWMSIFVKDWPKQWEKKKEEKKIQTLGFAKSIKKVLCNRYNWFGGIYTSFINLPIFVLGALWGYLFLSQGLQFPQKEATYINSSLFFGAIIGAPAIGWLSDKLQRRKSPMIVGGFLALIVILVIIYLPTHNFTFLVVLFFLLGFLTSAQTLGYPIVTELNSPLLTGSANSIVSMLVIAGGFVFQPLFGWLMEKTTSSYENTIAEYSLADFQRAMIILPLAFIVSIICSFFLKETRCRFIYK